ncbi:MAG: vWA domain-containing protein [Planctomycetota bacterium]
MFHINQDSIEEGDNAALETVLQRTPSVLASVILHLVVLILLALLMMARQVRTGPLVIEIGEAESDSVPIESISIEPVEIESSSEPIEQEMSEVGLESTEAERVEFDGDEFDGLFASVELKGFSKGFAKRIQDAKSNGIEIVIVFDSTGSMGSEIQNVKQRIFEISSAVLRKIPRAKFSLVTYRDQGDAYLARGIELQNDPRRMLYFVNGVRAGGGGDSPEAVQAGMRVAINDNSYRSKAQKVMILFGDAPPHEADLPECLTFAKRFRGYGKGQVHTVTCRASTPLPEFYAIAREGGGDAFVMNQADRLMEELLALAFGPKNREEVLRFFDVETVERTNQRRSRRRVR